MRVKPGPWNWSPALLEPRWRNLFRDLVWFSAFPEVGQAYGGSAVIEADAALAATKLGAGLFINDNPDGFAVTPPAGPWSATRQGTFALLFQSGETAPGNFTPALRHTVSGNQSLYLRGGSVNIETQWGAGVPHNTGVSGTTWAAGEVWLVISAHDRTAVRVLRQRITGSPIIDKYFNASAHSDADRDLSGEWHVGVHTSDRAFRTMIGKVLWAGVWYRAWTESEMDRVAENLVGPVTRAPHRYAHRIRKRILKYRGRR